VTPPAASALRVYGETLRAADPAAVIVRAGDGSTRPLAVGQYLAAADATDLALLDSVRGPVLDVGCGPGRHLHALAQSGVFALGVDLSPVAVELARGRGARAIVGSIFGDVPRASSWQTALLLDGNIGIGGVPLRLLQRLADLLTPTGEVLVELAPPGSRSGPVHVRLESAAVLSGWFPWADVGCDQAASLAEAAGFQAIATWCCGGRWFARLSRSPER
jgi:SAM-dependent methyltransferase